MVPAGSYLVCRWIRLKARCLSPCLNTQIREGGLKNAVTSKFTCNPMSIAHASPPSVSEIRSRCFLTMIRLHTPRLRWRSECRMQSSHWQTTLCSADRPTYFSILSKVAAVGSLLYFVSNIINENFSLRSFKRMAVLVLLWNCQSLFRHPRTFLIIMRSSG